MIHWEDKYKILLHFQSQTELQYNHFAARSFSGQGTSQYQFPPAHALLVPGKTSEKSPPAVLAQSKNKVHKLFIPSLHTLSLLFLHNYNSFCYFIYKIHGSHSQTVWSMPGQTN